VDGNAGVSGAYPNKESCESKCGNYECHQGNCVQNNLAPLGPGVYAGRNECEDAGCGRHNCVGGNCEPSSTLGPDGKYVGHFGSLADCEASTCGKFPVEGKQCLFDTGAPDGSALGSGLPSYAKMDQCVQSGCQKYKCDIGADDVGECVPDAKGQYATLKDCREAKTPCECPAGEKLCPSWDSKNRRCIECSAPKILSTADCECTECAEPKVKITTPGGREYCCDKCPEVRALNDAGVPTTFKDGISVPKDNDPCKCCPVPDCPRDALGNPIIEDLQTGGCIIVDRKTCKACPPCRANASHEIDNAGRVIDCSCDCEKGYKECSVTGGCVRCAPNKKLDSNCNCYCEQGPNHPQRVPKCQCGLKDDCSCAPLPTVNTCQQINYLSNGTCWRGPKICPPDQFLRRRLNVCSCLCLNGTTPPLGGGPCQDTSPGPIGPPDGGGDPGGGDPGGGDPGGGDGGGSSSTSDCPMNSSRAQNGICYCNEGYLIGTDRQCSQCDVGYVQDGQGGCRNPFGPGGGDGTGASFMPETEWLYEDKQDYMDMCDGVVCPDGKECVATVFGAECR
jgi:hypothetical protein